ncbi:MAG: sugar phosphate isomerase/epimerase [Ruminococcaceae bacterium]|nr:sugar phosphate isomerase/epimerase [Oscillospiraceae bacterium]
MKLGLLISLYRNEPLDTVLAKIKEKGVEMIEIAAGGYGGDDHCNPAELLRDEDKFLEFSHTIEKHGLTISAFSVHGNPVHPNKEIAKKFDEDYRNCVLLAERMGVDTITLFSGCPGGSPEDKTPNWATCAWPDDFLAVLDYQWNEVLIPYWKEAGAFAEAHGVTKLAFEMHPGFCVYNPETLLKLRKAVGPVIGCNFDPSHIVWQGMDPVAAIRELEGAIYHCHAKDTKVDKYNTAKNGVLDTKHYSDELHRSWVFRSVGYGNDMTYWRDMISNLRLTGYDYVMSIEHEDSVMSIDEGFDKAVYFLKQALIKEEKPTSMAWA